MAENELRTLRRFVPRTQASFAEEMGLPLRTYEDLESGRTALRKVHMNAAMWAIVNIAADDPFAGLSIPPGLLEKLERAVKNMKQLQTDE